MAKMKVRQFRTIRGANRYASRIIAMGNTKGKTVSVDISPHDPFRYAVKLTWYEVSQVQGVSPFRVAWSA